MKDKLKLLMQNRDPLLWPGGDVVAVNGFSKALKKVGVNIVQEHDYSVPADEFDVVMSWSINYPWVLSHLINAKLAGKPFIVFALSTNVNDKNFQKLIIDYADGIIFLSPSEKATVSKYLDKKIPEKKSFYVEVGVSNYFSSSKTTGKKGVLCVGRIEERKNQLNLVKACVKLNLPLKVVGHIADEGYYSQCLQAAEGYENIEFIPYVSNSELKELYIKSKVVANVATFEPWGLTIREAGLANCNILMTNKTYVKGDYPQVWWVDPKSVDNISQQLEIAYKAKNTQALKKYVADEYSWDNQSRKLKKALEKTMKNKSVDLKLVDWKKLAQELNGFVDGLNKDLGEKNLLIPELDKANKSKQLAIEEFQKSNHEKQLAIEELRKNEKENQERIHIFEKEMIAFKKYKESFWYKIYLYFNKKDSTIEK